MKAVRILGCCAALSALVPVGTAKATTFDGQCTFSGIFTASPGFAWTPQPETYSFDIQNGGCTGSLDGGPSGTFPVADGQTFVDPETEMPFTVDSVERGTAMAGCSPGGLFDYDAPGTGVIWLNTDDTAAGLRDLQLTTGRGVVVTPNVERSISGAAGGEAIESDQFSPTMDDLSGCTDGVASGGGVTSVAYTAQLDVLSGPLAD